MSGQFHTAQFPPGWVGTPFRLSGGGAARQRRCRGATQQYHAPDSGRADIPERRHRISVSLTCSSPARRRGRRHTGAVSYSPKERSGEAHRGWLHHPTPPVQPRSSMVERPRTDAVARSFPRRSEDRFYDGSWPGGEAVRAHPHHTGHGTLSATVTCGPTEAARRVMVASATMTTTRALTARGLAA